jgi:hypothetical protein
MPPPAVVAPRAARLERGPPTDATRLFSRRRAAAVMNQTKPARGGRAAARGERPSRGSEGPDRQRAGECARGRLAALLPT